MSYPGATATKFGRNHPPADRLETLHFRRATPLKTVSWSVPIPILDQEDLLAQGIETSTFIPGATNVDALGSCTCNSGTAHLAERLGTVKGIAAVTNAGLSLTSSPPNEVFAIKLYHATTDQTGQTSEEWPPNDCGSTGLYVCDELQAEGLIASHLAAASPEAVLSLLQQGSVMNGGPWFNSWMEPSGTGAFIDGDGSADSLKAAIKSGVAGGHERLTFEIDTLVMARNGSVDLQKTILVDRNSWSESWGDAGCYRVHLSTYAYLGGNMDYKQAVIAA